MKYNIPAIIEAINCSDCPLNSGPGTIQFNGVHHFHNGLSFGEGFVAVHWLDGKIEVFPNPVNRTTNLNWFQKPRPIVTLYPPKASKSENQ